MGLLNLILLLPAMVVIYYLVLFMGMFFLNAIRMLWAALTGKL